MQVRYHGLSMIHATSASDNQTRRPLGSHKIGSNITPVMMTIFLLSLRIFTCIGFHLVGNGQQCRFFTVNRPSMKQPIVWNVAGTSTAVAAAVFPTSKSKSPLTSDRVARPRKQPTSWLSIPLGSDFLCSSEKVELLACKKLRSADYFWNWRVIPFWPLGTR